MRPAVRALGASLALAASVLLIAGCTTEQPVERSPSISAPPPQRTIVPVPSSLQRTPGQPPIVEYGTVENPQIGVSYEYHLFVHCGVRAARFGGRWWQSVVPSDGRTLPNDRSQYVTGSMTLISPAVARFEWGGRSADFAPADVEPPPCL